MDSLNVRDIVFSSASDGDEDIYIMDAAGMNTKRLTWSTEAGITNRTPEWSPDGKKIVFQSNRDGSRQLYLINVEDEKVEPLTRETNDCNHPSWHPDGSKIIFTTQVDKRNRLQVVDVMTRKTRSITLQGMDGYMVHNPSFLPDGNRIACVIHTSKETPDALWTFDPEGRDPVKIGPDNLSVFEYDYSEVNHKIVFDAVVSDKPYLGDWDIFLMDEDGNSVKRLTTGSAMNSRPKWLSDGKTIVFHTNRFGRQKEQPSAQAHLSKWFAWWNGFEICRMNEEGQELKRLTNNNLRDLHPDG